MLLKQIYVLLWEQNNNAYYIAFDFKKLKRVATAI